MLTISCQAFDHATKASAASHRATKITAVMEAAGRATCSSHHPGKAEKKRLICGRGAVSNDMKSYNQLAAAAMMQQNTLASRINRGNGPPNPITPL